MKYLIILMQFFVISSFFLTVGPAQASSRTSCLGANFDEGPDRLDDNLLLDLATCNKEDSVYLLKQFEKLKMQTLKKLSSSTNRIDYNFQAASLANIRVAIQELKSQGQ